MEESIPYHGWKICRVYMQCEASLALGIEHKLQNIYIYLESSFCHKKNISSLLQIFPVSAILSILFPDLRHSNVQYYLGNGVIVSCNTCVIWLQSGDLNS